MAQIRLLYAGLLGHECRILSADDQSADPSTSLSQDRHDCGRSSATRSKVVSIAECAERNGTSGEYVGAAKSGEKEGFVITRQRRVVTELRMRGKSKRKITRSGRAIGRRSCNGIVPNRGGRLPSRDQTSGQLAEWTNAR